MFLELESDELTFLNNIVLITRDKRLYKKLNKSCFLYEGDGENAKLSQIEFIISDDQYTQLQDREKQQSGPLINKIQFESQDLYKA